MLVNTVKFTDKILAPKVFILHLNRRLMIKFAAAFGYSSVGGSRVCRAYLVLFGGVSFLACYVAGRAAFDLFRYRASLKGRKCLAP